jgi:hypothetical protein
MQLGDAALERVFQLVRGRLHAQQGAQHSPMMKRCEVAISHSCTACHLATNWATAAVSAAA